MHAVIRTYHIFKLVSLDELELIEVNDGFDYALAPFIFSHQLDELIGDVL